MDVGSTPVHADSSMDGWTLYMLENRNNTNINTRMANTTLERDAASMNTDTATALPADLTPHRRCHQSTQRKRGPDTVSHTNLTPPPALVPDHTHGHDHHYDHNHDAHDPDHPTTNDTTVVVTLLKLTLPITFTIILLLTLTIMLTITITLSNTWTSWAPQTTTCWKTTQQRQWE